MEKGRKRKVIAILALVVAVVGMSLGFAAFSNILIISSSATVTPNESDLNMVMYGIGEDVVYDVYVNSYSKLPIEQTLFNSFTVSKPFVSNWGNASTMPEGTLALIDNDNDKITNLTVNFTEPRQMINYVFLFKNEGKYDAYINFSDYAKYFNGVQKTCVAETGTASSVAEEVCENIDVGFGLFPPESNDPVVGSLTDSYKIVSGNYIRFYLQFMYSSPDLMPDGPVSISIDDFVCIFSTVPTGNVINE